MDERDAGACCVPEENGRILRLYFGLNLVAFATIARSGAAANTFIEPWLATVPPVRVGSPLPGAKPSVAAVRLASLAAVAAATAHFALPARDQLPPSCATENA